MFLNLTKNQRQALLVGIKEMYSIFWGPDPEKCGEMIQGSFWDPFDQLVLMPAFQIEEELNEIRLFTARFTAATHLFQHLEESYVRLFINNCRGISAPLFQSCYVPDGESQNPLLMGKPALMMKKRLESKGLSIDTHLHDPPDHLSIELEYLYFLLLNGWSSGNRAFIKEASTFASEILLPWVSEFQDRLAVEKQCRFYPLITSILTSFLEVITGSNREIVKA